MAGMGGSGCGEAMKERSSSFLKKRSKKLLLMASRTRVALSSMMLDVMSKSFLVLFFKKELLSSL
jgi:ABC-type uncharacterized transport system permease subunit